MLYRWRLYWTRRVPLWLCKQNGLLQCRSPRWSIQKSCRVWKPNSCKIQRTLCSVPWQSWWKLCRMRLVWSPAWTVSFYPVFIYILETPAMLKKPKYSTSPTLLCSLCILSVSVINPCFYIYVIKQSLQYYQCFLPVYKAAIKIHQIDTSEYQTMID